MVASAIPGAIVCLLSALTLHGIGTQAPHSPFFRSRTQVRDRDTAHSWCPGTRDFARPNACWGSLGFGCGAAIAWGYVQAGGCYAHYAECFGICQIPSNPFWESPCCPKVCGIPIPGISGSGCCDHGEACVGSHNPNTRDGCCPVGQECYGNCCAKGEYCLPGGICSVEPGYFPNTPPPPEPDNNCIFGGVPCFGKCCPPGLMCCGGLPGQPDCRTSCVH
jgi:hypothetical protein